MLRDVYGQEKSTGDSLTYPQYCILTKIGPFPLCSCTSILASLISHPRPLYIYIYSALQIACTVKESFVHMVAFTVVLLAWRNDYVKMILLFSENVHTSFVNVMTANCTFGCEGYRPSSADIYLLTLTSLAGGLYLRYM